MKPFYAFYNRSYGYARSLITFIIGLSMVIWPTQVKQYIVLTLGVIILLIGVVSVIIANTGKNKESKGSLLSLNGLVDIVFGLVLIIFPRFFASLIMFLFGILLLFLGGGEFFGLVRSRKEVKFSWTFFISPLITTACGIVMFFQPDESANWLFIFFGAALLLYSVTQLISTITIRSAFSHLEKMEKSEPSPKNQPTPDDADSQKNEKENDPIIEDVPFEEI